MGLFSSIKKIYTQVDKKVGGVLPGGSPSVLKGTVTTTNLPPVTISKPSTSTPSPTPSAPSPKPAPSSGGGTKPTIPGINRGTYNPFTGEYIDPSGVGSSRATAPPGAIITIVPGPGSIAMRRRTGGVNRPYAQSVLPSQNVLNKSINQIAKKIEQTGVVNKVSKAFDKVSGGVITRKNLNKEQAKLNTDISDFNKRFGGKELEENEYVKAQARALELEARAKALEMGTKQNAQSKTRKFWRFVFGSSTAGDPATYDFDKGIARETKNLEKLQQERSKAKSSLNKKRLDILVKAKKDEISKLERGQLPKLLTGDVPITPAGISFAKNVKIQFIGTQKNVGRNKIVTDIIFKSNKGDVGLAKGITLVKGKSGYSFVGGRFGTAGVKFPTAKPTIKQLKTFAGIEKSITRAGSVKVTQQLNLLNRAKRTGQIARVSRNIKILKQIGIGRVATARGTKLIRTGIKFPSGKLFKFKAKSLLYDNVASVSAIMKKKDLSLIIGKSITSQGNKAKFIGLIKGVGGKNLRSFSVSGKTAVQYKKALSKVVTAVAGALSKSKKISGLTKAQSLAVASNIVAKLPRTQAGTISKTAQITRQVPRSTPSPRGATAQTQPRNSQGQFIKSRGGGGGTRQRQATAVTTVQRTAQRTAQSTLQRTRQTTRQLQRQNALQRTRQLQRSRQLQRQRQLQQLKTRQVLRQQQVRKLTIPRPRLTFRMLPFAIRKAINSAVPKRRRGNKIGYFLFEKVKGKYRKIKTPPLPFSQARDKLALRIDNRLSRSIRLVPVKVKKLGRLRKREIGYFTKFKRNIRNYKIVRGKRVSTPLTFIERQGRPLISTRGEKRQLAIARARSRPTIRRTGRFRGFSARRQTRDSHGRFIKRKR